MDASMDNWQQFYDAIIKKDAAKVLKLREPLVAEGPLHVVTIHDDTILHLALYSMQLELVLSLIDTLAPEHIALMVRQNSGGNTILHEAATYDKLFPAAEIMLRLQPELLTIRNNNKENPLFRAARYGQMKMFKFLNECLVRTLDNVELERAHRKFDGSTILHAAIAAEHFDSDGLTALQLLACNPAAFQFRGRGCLMKIIDSRIINSGAADDDRSYLHEVASPFSVPWWDEMVRKRKTYHAVVELANILIPKDTSWTITKSVVDQRETENADENETKSREKTEKEKALEKKRAEKQQTPLLLATQTGCFEIVKRILEVHPQAVEHIDEDGRCILHIAIKYRQMAVFEMVHQMDVPMRRLIRKCDVKGNSILHMVGKKIVNEDVQQTEKRSPSFQLQDDLLLFETISKVIRPHFHKHTNKDGETAEELFALNKEPLREKSQEWLKRTAENCSIVAVLIATVAFAAAYTIPGGSKEEDGSPVLLNQPFFVLFTITDVLSLTFCLTSVVIFLSILTSSFRLNDFKRSLPQQLMLGITCLILSVSMMMLAFAATVILMIRNNQQWTRIALYLVAFLPVTVFAVIYLPLYLSLMGTCTYTIKKWWSYVPRIKCKNCGKSLDGTNEHPSAAETSASRALAPEFLQVMSVQQ
uniref:PGG domain-containing protein n=1 Tax=Daucus carota subsp. sativus TaxID=79200 RepID=A0A175YNU0_DAUCS